MSSGEFGFPGGSEVKHPPAMQEMQVQSLGREDPLEEEMATHSRIIAWKIPWTEESSGLQSVGVTKSRTQLSDYQFISFSSTEMVITTSNVGKKEH